MRIVTVNVYGFAYAPLDQIIQETCNGEFDVFNIQEYNHFAPPLIDKNYKCIQSSNYTGLLSIINPKNGWKLQNYKEELWKPNIDDNRIVPRSALILHLENEYCGSKVSIANVHLCGGRYDELYVNQVKSHELHMFQNTMLSLKNGLLHQVLRHEPDVIVGDFNSDVICYIDQSTTRYRGYVHPAQLQFWKQLCTELSTEEDVIKDRLIQWNCAPFELLEKSGYKLVLGKNEREEKRHTSWFAKHGTSVFGPTPDAIWYKKGADNNQKVTIDLFHRICLINGDSHDHLEMLSDHDALLACFRIKESSTS